MCNKKIRNVNIDYMRMANASEHYIIQDNEYFFPYEKIRELLAMACEDIYPDGGYGDAECCLWGDMREILRKENLKK